jgi:hypothetical protein
MTKLAGEPLTFAYTDKQWADIEQSLRYLQPNQAAVETARRQALERRVATYGWPPLTTQDLRTVLCNAASRYLFGGVNGPALASKNKEIAKRWTRTLTLSDDLRGSLTTVATLEEHPPNPDGGPPHDFYQDHKLALEKLSKLARRRSAEAINDGFPKVRSRAWFHFRVLEVWTDLGGKLQISRHPTTGKIKGPLARYFVAATQPVHGGSLESLPDILARQKTLMQALHEYRIEEAKW